MFSRNGMRERWSKEGRPESILVMFWEGEVAERRVGLRIVVLGGCRRDMDCRNKSASHGLRRGVWPATTKKKQREEEERRQVWNRT
jgi:hypothetical protein